MGSRMSERRRRSGFQRNRENLWSIEVQRLLWWEMKSHLSWRWIILPIPFLSMVSCEVTICEFGNKPRRLPSFHVIEMSCYRLIGGLWAPFSLAIWLAWERMWWNGIFRTVNFLVCNRFLPPVAFPITHSHEIQDKFYLTLSCALIYNVIVQLKYMSFSFLKKVHFVW